MATLLLFALAQRKTEPLPSFFWAIWLGIFFFVVLVVYAAARQRRKRREAF